MKDHIVEFQVCTVEDNFISYKLKRDFTPGNGDWIGVFPNRFSSLDDYVVYEYVSRGKRLLISSLILPANLLFIKCFV